MLSVVKLYENHCGAIFLGIESAQLPEDENDEDGHLNEIGSVIFCSLAVLDSRVGHTMDVLSPFIPVLCHFD